MGAHSNFHQVKSALSQVYATSLRQTKAAQQKHQVSEPAKGNGYLQGRTKKSAPAGSYFEGSKRLFF